MASENRDGKRKYYTRICRVQGRVTREDVGRGPIADVTAAVDELERQESALQAKVHACHRGVLQAAEGLLKELCDRTDLLARAVLVSAGYYRYHGIWTLRRDAPEVHESPEAGLASDGDLKALVQRAEIGDPAALPMVRQHAGAGSEIWQVLDGMVLEAERCWLGLVMEWQPLLAKSVLKHYASMKAEPTGSEPRPLVALLVTCVTLTRLQACHLDALVAEHQANEGGKGHGRFLHGQRDRAHKRSGLMHKRLVQVRNLLPKLPEEALESTVEPPSSSEG